MFKQHCDRCGRFMGDVSGPQAKEISISGDTICKSCLDTEDKLVKMTERLKRQWDGKINQVIADAKDELTKALGELKG